MEITITELILFAWAIGATGAALKYHDENRIARFFLKQLIENPEARERMVAEYDRVKKAMGG